MCLSACLQIKHHLFSIRLAARADSYKHEAHRANIQNQPSPVSITGSQHIMLKSKTILLVAGAFLPLLWPGSTCAAASIQDVKIDIPYQKFVLTNGLTLIVHEDHKAPIVAVNVWYHVGSKNERPGKTGFAHLFEHLMFGGSEHFKGRYIDALERIGATDLNGTTSEDRTNYF